MPEPRTHLASLVDDFARHGSQIAIVAQRGMRHQKITYGALATLSRRFASELIQRGIGKGDRVLIWGENSAEWVAAFFGCVLRGVLPVPIDHASPPEFAKRVEHEVSPKLIVTEAERLGIFGPGDTALDLAELGQTLPAESAGALGDVGETDALQIVFTSGTTGEPKGVVHTHKNVLASLRPIEAEMQKYLRYERLVHPIRFLHTLPLSHVFGQFMGLWVPALLAAEVHYESRLVASDIITRIRHERISVLVAVPRLLDLLQRELGGRHPELPAQLEASRGMKAWKRWWRFRRVHRAFGLKFWAFVCGGASLPSASEHFWNTLGFVVVQGYGMTETTALVSLNHPFKAAQGSVGQVLPGREVRLGEDGEVFVRGDTISSSVWQNGVARKLDSEWLATGDLAEFDEHGNLRFRGRKKDVIVTSAGLNIYPEDVEAALQRQPGVKASTVVEASGPHGPEMVAALVLSGEVDGSRVVDQANQELADFQRVRRWVVWQEPDLPRTSTGKVLRREVARRLESGELPEASAGELNLDSLGRVELQARLEQQYGIVLEDTVLQAAKTEEELRALVSAHQGSTTITKDPHSYPRWVWHPVMQAIRAAFLEVIAMPLLRFLTKTKVRNVVRDWPDRPVLIVANHITSYDAAFLLYALPGRMRRRVAIAMSGEMLLDLRRGRNQGSWFVNLVAPIGYWLVTGLFNVFPLPQFSGFRRSFAHAAEAVDRGYSVIVFPEGIRSDDGTPLPFKQGAGLLWKELGTAALAMRLEGLGELKVTGARWFRSGRITVSARQALPGDRAKSPAELTELLKRAVFE